MVSPLTEAMQKEWLLPRFMLCGGFTENLALSYTWYGLFTIYPCRAYYITRGHLSNGDTSSGPRSLYITPSEMRTPL